MKSPYTPFGYLIFVWSIGLTFLFAQQEGEEGLSGSITTRRNARTMTLSIPAPRGQITDREGYPLAQTRVAWYPALQFGAFEKASKDYVLAWAAKRIDAINQLFSTHWNPSPEALWGHYTNRRWIPMTVEHPLNAKEKASFAKKLPEGVVLHPVYLRYYPQKEVGAHIIGYVGSKGKLPEGPISYGDPFFEEEEGRSGFEKVFNKELTGKSGLLRQDFDSDGTLVLKELTQRAESGLTVVSTLDLRWQRWAHKVLKKHCQRGAFVILDIQTGEVLVMASAPSFDLNAFIPFISNEDYKKLAKDPSHPLFDRSSQAVYPPASTFKPVVALAALDKGAIRANTLIDCPAKIKIGNHWFANWSKVPEGAIAVRRALARSCNPWFYQVGILTGPTSFLDVAARLGFGSKTGLPLVGEASGLLPDNVWMKKHHGRRILDGDTANLSIGQGVLLATPLQVAQAMAGIAQGGVLPKLHLIKQIQRPNGEVLAATHPEARHSLHFSPEALGVVSEGMMEVVHASYGTGKRAELSFTVMCGKTGTAQWGPASQEKRLAWFAGFFPLANPRYAFAALYEGKPHESLSGGRVAAPMVSDFFEHFKKEIKKNIAPPPRAMVVDESGGVDRTPPRAIEVQEEDFAPNEVFFSDESSQQERDTQRRPPRAIEVEE